MALRTSQLRNTLYNPDSSVNAGAKVSALLGPATSAFQYNIAGASFTDTVQQTLISTLTATVAPLTVPAGVAVGSGGALSDGDYSYKVSFIYAVTSSTAAYESAGSVASATVTAAASDSINLTAIPLGGTGCTARRLYRTHAEGSIWQLLTTIADNTTTVYTDVIADASLGSDTPLVLGEYRLNLVAPLDLLPANGSYLLSEAAKSFTTSSFAYQDPATPYASTALYSSAPPPATPTVPYTEYVVDASGNGISGIGITANLFQDGVSTVSSNTIKASATVPAKTDANGFYSLPLVPVDALVTPGNYYIIREGTNAIPKSVLAVSNSGAGGTVNDNIFVPVPIGSNIGVALSPSDAQTGSVNVSGKMQADSFSGTADAVATITPLPACAGTGAAVTGSAGTDVSGKITLISGSAAWAIGNVVEVSFDQTKSDVPQVFLTPLDDITATAMSASKISTNSTTDGFNVRFGVADTAATTYHLGYVVFGS